MTATQAQDGRRDNNGSMEDRDINGSKEDQDKNGSSKGQDINRSSEDQDDNESNKDQDTNGSSEDQDINGPLDENNLIRHFYQNAFFTNKILFTIVQNQCEIINNLRFVSETIGVRGGVTWAGAGSMGEESLGFGGLNVSTGGRMGNGSVRLETVGGLTVPATGGHWRRISGFGNNGNAERYCW